MALMKQERTVDKPLDRLGFFGTERDKMKLLDQEMKKVTEDGHAWLDYRLTVSHSGSTEPWRMFFRADAVTKLPAFCRYEGRLDGKATTAEAALIIRKMAPPTSLLWACRGRPSLSIASPQATWSVFWGHCKRAVSEWTTIAPCS